MPGIWKSEAGRDAVLARYAEFLRYWPQPCVQRSLPTSQGETFVIEGGKEGAPVVVFLHGGSSNSVTWLRDAAVLGERFKVYAVDMIGEPGFSAPARPPLASEAYATWLEEVMAGLGVERAALVGISLGGWLALDFAIRRPGRVSALALLCPGGVGATRNILLWAAPLLLTGPWGRKLVLKRLGSDAVTRAAAASPAAQAFGAFIGLIRDNFRPRREPLPRFTDAALRGLTMPLLAIMGGKDAILDMHEARARLSAQVAQAEIRWLPEAGHFLIGHGAEIDAFLAKALLA